MVIHNRCILPMDQQLSTVAMTLSERLPDWRQHLCDSLHFG